MDRDWVNTAVEVGVEKSLSWASSVLELLLAVKVRVGAPELQTKTEGAVSAGGVVGGT
jgi:hypothetical protein